MSSVQLSDFEEKFQDPSDVLNDALNGCFIEASLKPGLVKHRLKNQEKWINI